MSDHYVDGGRFSFRIVEDGWEMYDEKGEFETVKLSRELATYLGHVTWQHHTMMKDKSNMFSKLIGLIELVKKESEMDKDVLIACINNAGVDND